MFLQVIRFTLPSTLTISAPAFRDLRQKVVSAGATAQYFGYSAQAAAALPKERHEICWALSQSTWLDISSLAVPWCHDTNVNRVQIGQKLVIKALSQKVSKDCQQEMLHHCYFSSPMTRPTA
jgi:hypothetical protein